MVYNIRIKTQFNRNESQDWTKNNNMLFIKWRSYIMKFEDKVVVVNGANSGVGNETAKLIAKEGASVVVIAKESEALENLIHKIKIEGGKAIAVTETTNNEKDVQDAINTAINEFGKVDIIINSVCVADVIAPVADIGEGIWKIDLKVDLTGAI